MPGSSLVSPSDHFSEDTDYPEIGSREWFQDLWSRTVCAADRCNWTFLQALRITEGQHCAVFPRDLRLMPIRAIDWYQRVRDVADQNLIGWHGHDIPEELQPWTA